MTEAVQPAPFQSQRSLSRHFLATTVLAAALVLGIGGWAMTTQLSSAIVASGTVVVENDVKKIRHLTGGIVGALPVREGDSVKAGQVLIRLDATTVQANLSIVQNTLAQLYARRSRLRAEQLGAPGFTIPEDISALTSRADIALLEASERKLFESRRDALLGMKNQLQSRKAQLVDEAAGLTVQVKATEDALAVIAEEVGPLQGLYSQGLVSMQRLNALKRERAQLEGDRGARIASRAQTAGRSNEIDLQSLQLDEDRRSEIAKELTEVEAKIAEDEERRIAALDQLKRVDIRAPVDGRIYQLDVHAIDSVVNPGDVLMLVVPDTDDLMVDAKIATSDIDQLRVGQPVEIRFSAFNQRTTPQVDAEIVTISPDVITEERTGLSHYRVRIRPKPDSLARLKGLSLYPGMPAEVFMKIADRSVISYLAKPLIEQMRHTFREN
jgi:membrane fusion protein